MKKSLNKNLGLNKTNKKLKSKISKPLNLNSKNIFKCECCSEPSEIKKEMLHRHRKVECYYCGHPMLKEVNYKTQYFKLQKKIKELKKSIEEQRKEVQINKTGILIEINRLTAYY